LLPSVPEEKLPFSLEGHDAQKLCTTLVEILLEKGKNDYEAGTKSPHEAGITRSEKIRRMQLQPIPMVFPQTDVQLGQTKVFMRKPAHDALEAHKVFHQTAAATILQAWIRGLQKRVHHLILCEAALTAQRFYRGCKGRERWWRLREAVAGDLLTKNMRMLLIRRKFITAKTGTILFQSVYRGHATRRLLAAIKIQAQVRTWKYYAMYTKLKSATISLQCRQRKGIAKKVLAALKHEQKDIGKLKQNNEKLKSEMASLKAMLAAQAKQGAMKASSDKELLEKQAEIKQHLKRIQELEELLEQEKENVKKIEGRLDKKESFISQQQEKINILTQQNQNLTLSQTASPRKSKSNSSLPPSSPVASTTALLGDSDRGASFRSYNDDSQALAEARAQVARLEKALEEERAARRETDSEVIRLRAQASGISLGDDDVKALLPSDDDIKSSIMMPVIDDIAVPIETQNTSDSNESDER
jgi:myosin heavy subunit